MNSIFISYRRGDSAGHAGRLFDRLKDRLGAERVFMDVSDLRPGQDFVAELERAVAQADCLLAVIGPRWLDALDASGRRRIDDPDDLVRREIATALSQGSSVIPVLVHGAVMPRAEDLPAVLQPLARRQAIDISDERWDSDFAELLQLLAASGHGAASAAAASATVLHSSPARRRTGTIALMALLLVVMVLVAVMHKPATNAPAAAAAGAPADAATPTTPSADNGASAPASNATLQPRFAITLPPVSEVRFRTGRGQVVFTLLAIRQEPRDGSTQIVTMLVRMRNLGPYDEAFGSDQFRLMAGDQAIAPTATLIGAVEATAAKEARLGFIVPATVTQVALEVRVNADSTRMPIALTERTPLRANDAPTGAVLDDFGRPQPPRLVDVLKTLPAPFATVGQRVEVGGASYQLRAAVIERDTVEKASLTLTIRCTAPAGISTYFGSSSVRLWIDGVPRAPVNFVNMAIDPRDSKEASFVFDLSTLPRSLEVGILNGDDSARIALPLGELARR